MFEKLKELNIDYDTLESINDIPEEEKEKFKKIFGTICEECKKKNREGKEKEVFDAIEDELQNRKMQTEMKEIFENMFYIYNSMQELREKETEEKNQVKILINDVFDKQIFRKESSFSTNFVEYQLSNEEALNNISNAMWSLVNFYILNRYSSKDIIVDFVEETGLSEEIARAFMEQIDKNYSTLQMIVLLERMKYFPA